METEPIGISVHCTGCGEALTITVEPSPAPDPLTEGRRQSHPLLIGFDLEVLQLAADGLSDAEIARAMGASIHRVKHAVRRSLLVLRARNRTHAAAMVAAERLRSKERSTEADPAVGSS